MKKIKKENLTTLTRITVWLGVNRKIIYNRLKKQNEIIGRGLLSEADQRKVFLVMRVSYDDFFEKEQIRY